MEKNLSVKKIGMETNLESVEKAFDWLVLLVTILNGVIFAYWKWLTSQSTITLDVLTFTARLMFSLIVPLVVLLFPVLWQNLTSNVEHKIALRMFSWGALIFIFAYYVLLFLSLELVSLTRGFVVAYVISSVGSIVVIVLFQFPFRKIVALYKESTPNSKYWKKREIVTWVPYIVGLVLTGLIILLSFFP